MYKFFTEKSIINFTFILTVLQNIIFNLLYYKYTHYLVNYKRFIIFNLLSILCLYFITRVVSLKVNIILSLILNIFILISFILNVFYFYYYNTEFTIRTIKNIGDFSQINVKSTLLEILKNIKTNNIFYYLILLILFFIIIYYILIIVSLIRGKLNSKYVIDIQKTYSIALFCICFITNSIWLNDINKESFFKYLFNSNYVVSNFGYVYYNYLNINNFILSNSKRIKPTLDENAIYLTLNKKSNGNKKYDFKPNIILLQVEAFQSFLIDSKINGVEITPNLNRLKNTEWTYLKNFYYQTSIGNTSDAEFAVDTSMVPFNNLVAFKEFNLSRVNSLPKMLKDEGYFTAVLHAYKKNFWNRNNIYPQLGYVNYESEHDFIINEELGMGLSDESFLKQVVDKIENYPKPFYIKAITLTSHYPYDEMPEVQFNVGELEDTTLGRFLKLAHYTDMAIGKFIEELKQRGLYDNSIIIIYGDHHAITQNDIPSLEKLLNKKIDRDKWINYSKVVGLIHLPNQKENMIIEQNCGFTDIMPTIVDLLGIKTEFYTTGNNIFDKTDKNNYVIFKDGSFVYNDFYYNRNSEDLYDLKHGIYFKPTKEDKKIIQKMKKIKEANDSYILIRNKLK